MRILVVDDDRARARRAAARADARRLRGRTRPRTARRRWRRSPTAGPTPSCSTSACPASTGSRCAGGCARAGNRVPVLMLTARDAVADRIDGLDAGADDYLVKPFDVGELQGAAARAAAPRGRRRRRRRAGVRRAAAGPRAPRRGRRRRLRRADAHRVPAAGAADAQPAAACCRTSVIYDRVWGYDFGPASNALRVYVGYLRRKLEQAGARAADPHRARRRLRPARAMTLRHRIAAVGRPRRRRHGR